MLDPCIGCRSKGRCRTETRKQDCLTPYPNLRRISNSPDGFKVHWDSSGWSQAERDFYNSQIRAIHPWKPEKDYGW